MPPSQPMTCPATPALPRVPLSHLATWPIPCLACVAVSRGTSPYPARRTQPSPACVAFPGVAGRCRAMPYPASPLLACVALRRLTSPSLPILACVAAPYRPRRASPCLRWLVAPSRATLAPRSLAPPALRRVSAMRRASPGLAVPSTPAIPCLVRPCLACRSQPRQASPAPPRHSQRSRENRAGQTCASPKPFVRPLLAALQIPVPPRPGVVGTSPSQSPARLWNRGDLLPLRPECRGAPSNWLCPNR